MADGYPAAVTGIHMEAVVITIAVYLDDGRVFEYDVATPGQAREHSAAIVGWGYRRVEGNVLTHYPAHRICKVKATGEGITTNYPDRERGT